VPSTPRPASTVVLVRPAIDAFEVFLVRRHDSVAFMGGAHVFPGGRVDDADAIAGPERWCDGVSEAVARASDRGHAEAVAFHVAAIRELFEEAGVLLARDGDRIVEMTDGDAQRYESCRRDLLEQRLSMQELAEREGLRLALDALALFARWVTPVVETRRFDTCFFLAIAPVVQHAAHDERETTQGTWMRPGEALERCLAGEIALPPPTWTTLRWLSRLATAGEAWQRAVSMPRPIPRIQPCVEDRGNGTRVIMLPGDPLCPAVTGFDAEETRFELTNGRWRPVAPD
jgi:8-oxo-dGTP pyrophosphatase MutT (NUDIX family)